MLYFIIIMAVILILILLRVRYETRHFKIQEYKIVTDKITDEIKFAFITDLHNCKYGDKNQSVIEAIVKENCSFLVIGGDLISGKRNIGEHSPLEYCENAIDFLNGISGKIPVFYTFGNHETRIKNRKEKNPIYETYIKGIEQAEITYLNDKMEVWENDKDVIRIKGYEMPEQVYDNSEEFDIFELVDKTKDIQEGKNVRDDSFCILTVHSPEFFKDYVKTRTDLILCGHNHGGTVRLPFVGGLISRDYKLFPKYSYGIYEKNGKKMILTSGLGDHTIHFRLFNMPEIVVITLQPEKSI